MGDTQTTVINFTNKLVKVNIFPTLATQFGEERHISKRMNKDDYALIISYRGQEKTSRVCTDIEQESCENWTYYCE